jgi:TatD DNase family protein
MGGSTWVDTHGHLFLIEDDPRSVLERAAAVGVGWLMCPGVDVETSEAAWRLAEDFPASVLWSAGIHPHDAELWPALGDRIAELVESADAVGECGLDWYRELAPRDAQRLAFHEQLTLAEKHGKPVIIHCRDAFADVFDALSRTDLGDGAVLHCWTGGPRWTKRFAELGVAFSFAGPLTYATGDTLRLAAQHVPPERTLLETDAPYLTPEPVRSDARDQGGRGFVPNEPSYLPLTGSALASVWGVGDDEVARVTTENAERIFGGPRG